MFVVYAYSELIQQYCFMSSIYKYTIHLVSCIFSVSCAVAIRYTIYDVGWRMMHFVVVVEGPSLPLLECDFRDSFRVSSNNLHTPMTFPHNLGLGECATLYTELTQASTDLTQIQPNFNKSFCSNDLLQSPWQLTATKIDN